MDMLGDLLQRKRLPEIEHDIVNGFLDDGAVIARGGADDQIAIVHHHRLEQVFKRGKVLVRSTRMA